MFAPFFTPRSSYFLVSVFVVGISSQALATSCQVYPSEYAYRGDSVNRAESVSANCRNYPPGLQDGIHPENYIHCDGTQLKLADSTFRQEQYRSSDYYVWSATRGSQLLFILPTRVSLTTITLHYYSDSDQGLPRLRFYAVPDNFNVWNAPTVGTPHVDVAAVPPVGEPAGHRNVSINVDFSAKKVLMYKFSSSFQFAVSEVEFFTCNAPFITTEAITTTSQPTIAATSITSVTTNLTFPPMVTITGSTKDMPYTTVSSSGDQISPKGTVAWVLVAIPAVLQLHCITMMQLQAMV